MSKAFTREPDDEMPDRLPEIPLPPPPNPVTAEGHRQIVTTIEALERRLAAEPGSLGQADLERAQRDHRYWTARLISAQLTASPTDPDEVGFGSEVTVAWPERGEVTLRIVGEDEADPAQGLIGWRSPVAAALTGSGVGDQVVVPLASDDIHLTILAVRNTPPGG